MATKKQVEELETRLNKKLEDVLEKLSVVEGLSAEIASLKGTLARDFGLPFFIIKRMLLVY
jgi:hypothetical protein